MKIGIFGVFMFGLSAFFYPCGGEEAALYAGGVSARDHVAGVGGGNAAIAGCAAQFLAFQRCMNAAARGKDPRVRAAASDAYSAMRFISLVEDTAATIKETKAIREATAVYARAHEERMRVLQAGERAHEERMRALQAGAIAQEEKLAAYAKKDRERWSRIDAMRAENDRLEREELPFLPNLFRECWRAGIYAANVAGDGDLRVTGLER
jgi:hypothetical protein